VERRTPFDIVRAVEQPRPVTKRELIAVSRSLEGLALDDRPDAVAATLQDSRFLTARTREVYTRLAAGGTAVTLLARGLHGWLAPGVRGVDLDEDDPLVDQWVLVVGSPRQPTVMAATDLKHPSATDAERSFEYAVSRDAAVVTACLALLAPYTTAQGVPPSRSGSAAADGDRSADREAAAQERQRR